MYIQTMWQFLAVGGRDSGNNIQSFLSKQIANNDASACTPDIMSNYFDTLEQMIQDIKIA